MKTRLVAVLLFATGVMCVCGCNMGKSFTMKKKSSPAPKTQPPLHQGFQLTVLIDGRQTQQGDLENGAQIWVAPVCWPTPLFQFSMDTLALGKIVGEASMTIYPKRRGKIDLTDFFVYTGGKKLIPGKVVRLNHFTHFHDHLVEPNLLALPPGEYRFTLKVRGDKEKQWDRQYIDAIVK